MDSLRLFEESKLAHVRVATGLSPAEAGVASVTVSPATLIVSRHRHKSTRRNISTSSDPAVRMQSGSAHRDLVDAVVPVAAVGGQVPGQVLEVVAGAQGADQLPADWAGDGHDHTGRQQHRVALMRRDPGSAFRTSATCRSAAAADRWVGAKGMGLPPAGMGLPPAVAGATPLRAMAVAAIASRVASLRTRRIGTREPTKASPPVGACDGAGLCWGQAWRDPLAGSHRRAGAPPPARCPTAAASWQRPRRRTRKRTGNSTGNLHPWAEVAAWSGRTMHRLAQFHAISRPAAAPAGPAPWNDEDPPAGNLPAGSCASRAEPSPSTPVRPNPAGSACGTA